MMRRSSVLKSLTVFMAGGLLFTSCLEDPEPVPLDAIPDVFVQKTMQDAVVRYGLSFWVLGNKELQSVGVEGPGDGNWSLVAEGDVKRVFIHYPETGDYTNEMPAVGDYTFTITSAQTGESSLSLKDKLETREIDVAVIDSIGFGNTKLYLSWEPVENAEKYYIRLFDESEKLLFQSMKLNDDAEEFSFGLTDDGWANTEEMADDGETYRLEVIAMLYEINTIASNRDYNVQMISIASHDVVWGE